MLSVKVCYQGKEEKIQLPDKSRIADVLEKMRINRETVIVARNREIVPDTIKMEKKDIIDVVRITSGG